MSNIADLRATADVLFEQGKFEEAYGIYHEVYTQVWTAIGVVQAGLNEFSQGYLNHNYRLALQFRNDYTVHAVNAIFIKYFELDSDDTLNEFIFTSYGRLKCIAASRNLLAKTSFLSVASEFLTLYTMILESGSPNWIGGISKIIIPAVEDKKIKKMRIVLPENILKDKLVSAAKLLKETDWHNLNFSLLEYLDKIEEKNSDLYSSISSIAGPYSSHRKHYKNSRDGKQDYKRYEKYESYEKYERYEKYEWRSSAGEKEFDLKNSTEFEKAKYFGELFGLQGKVSHGYIRKKYIELISQYHPDKVAGLGPELIKLAEKKAKEINAAYEWFKQKYNI